MSETPGPYVATKDFNGDRAIQSTAPGEEGIVICLFEGRNAEDDRRRFLACAQFCDGVPTAVIERCVERGGLFSLVALAEYLSGDREATHA